MTVRPRLWGLVGVLILSTLLVACGGKTEEPVPEGTQVTTPEPETKPEQTESENSITVSMRNAETLHPIYNMEKSVEQTLHLL
ncbi:MAG: hypothetical protein ACRCW2_04245, partial [Cellulosilyticaceae bacterium]